MNGYAEVIQVVGAMVIFSIILLSTNRYMLSNTQQQVASEVEMLAVTLGQDLIEEALLRPFDSVTVDGHIPIQMPEEFAAPNFPHTTAGNRSDIASYEGYHGWEEVMDTNLGPYEISAEVHYVTEDDPATPTTIRTRHKRMVVTVTNPSLTNPVRVAYVRTYNHD
ncbi:MAG: hypothetical protein WDZ29_00645 [Balneolaceae bacterium]